MSQPLRVGSLFAGIGGFELGLEMTGHFKTVWQVEQNTYASRVLAKHWPDVARHDDICTFPTDGVDWSCDMICGGWPCQDLSYAGAGAGLDGQRSGLFFELVRVVRGLGPRYVVLENVAALLNRGMGDVLGLLASIGYDVQWHCISASAVGAPHKRDRVFIIADRRRERLERIEQGGATRRATRRVGRESAGLDSMPALRGLHLHDVSSFARLGVRLSGGRRSDTTRLEYGPIFGSESWPALTEPVRVANGVPNRMDRLKCLGNAVVPQVARLVGEIIWRLHDGQNEPE